MSVGGSRNIYKILLLSVIACVMQSCEDNDIDPASYEKYISISADQYPAISPDGTRVAYYHRCLEFPEPVDYPTGLYVMDVDGTNRNLVIRGDHFSPDWSPDGRSLVFSSNGTLQIINVDDDNIRTFNGLPGFPELPLHTPDWSSDGEEIIFSAPLTTNGGVFKVTPDLLSVKRILLPVTNNGMYASWSPDRSKIVYQKGNRSLESVEIFIIDTAMISEQQLTHDKKDDRAAKWSPNGEVIAWSSDVRITTININGNNRKTLGYGRYPSWSPGSDFLIYSFANSDYTKEVLWRINIDGSNNSQITF
jgi:Tol biopolymer transport system component